MGLSIMDLLSTLPGVRETGGKEGRRTTIGTLEQVGTTLSADARHPACLEALRTSAESRQQAPRNGPCRWALLSTEPVGLAWLMEPASQGAAKVPLAKSCPTVTHHTLMPVRSSSVLVSGNCTCMVTSSIGKPKMFSLIEKPVP